MFEPNRKKSHFKSILTVLIASLGVCVLFFTISNTYVNKSINKRTPTPNLQNEMNVPEPQQISTDITPQIQGPITVARAATKSVVGISVLKVGEGDIFDKNASQKWGLGSGTIVSANGYILTNNHVAGGKNKRIIISLSDGRNIDGVTVWADPVIDLAVVKINVDGLPAMQLGDATKLQVGEQAIAIGNPLGLEFQRTVTSGIISALNRTIKIDTDQGTNYMEDLIQTDASINPGNSGGPLLNTNGQIIGVNTVKVSSAEGMGFAIPINVAIPIVNKFVQNGDFSESYLGVFAYDKEMIPYLNGQLNIEKGIYVANVDENGPAFKSGIKVGCIITQVDGNDVNTMMQLRTFIYSKMPGDTIKITHISDGKTMTIPIVLKSKSQDGLITR